MSIPSIEAEAPPVDVSLMTQILASSGYHEANERLRDFAAVVAASTAQSPSGPAQGLLPQQPGSFGGRDLTAARFAAVNMFQPDVAAQLLREVDRLASSPTIGEGGLVLSTAVLGDPTSVSLFGAAGLAAFGLDPTVPSSEQRVAFAARNGIAPSRLPNIDLAAVRQTLSNGINPAATGFVTGVANLRKSDGGDDAGDGPGGAPGPKPHPTGGGWTPPAGFEEKVKTFIENIGSCRCHADWWGWSVDFDPAEAKLMQEILEGSAVAILVSALKAGLAAGGTIVAILGAAAAAVGGWWVLALVAFASYIAAELAFNVTPRGVSLQGLWVPGVVWAKGL